MQEIASLNKVKKALISRTTANDGAAAAAAATTPNVMTYKTVPDALSRDKDPAASGGN